MGGFFPPGYFPGDGGGAIIEGPPVSILYPSSEFPGVTWKSADGETLAIPGYWSNGYVLTSLEGISTPAINLIQDRSPFQDGSTSLRADVQPRTITFDITFFGVDRGDLESRRRLVGRLFSPRTKTGDLNVGTLTVSLSDQTQYSIFAVPTSLDDSGRRGPGWFSFGVDLFADDPFFYGVTRNISLIPGGGITFPITFPLVLTGGDILINNNGELPVYPVIQIDGSVTNPEVTNLTTGKSIAINVVVPTGQRLEIDSRFGYKTIQFVSLSDSTRIDQFDKLDPDSEFWPLIVGENRLRFNFDSGSASGNVIYADRFNSVAAA